MQDYAGGGAAAERAIPGVGVALGCDPNEVSANLRRGELPVVTRVSDEHLVLSMRTIDPADDDLVADALLRASDP